jgi:hypothetical protein
MHSPFKKLLHKNQYNGQSISYITLDSAKDKGSHFLPHNGVSFPCADKGHNEASDGTSPYNNIGSYLTINIVYRKRGESVNVRLP